MIIEMRPITAFMFSLLFPALAMGQSELSVYGATTVQVSGDEAGRDSSLIEPIAIGVEDLGIRFTWWQSPEIGFAVDYGALIGAHTDLENGRLESGKMISVRAMRRWNSGSSQIAPYLAAGIGLGLSASAPDPAILEEPVSEFGRPELLWAAGASLPLTERMSLFGEISHSFGTIQNISSVTGSDSRFDVGVTFGF